MSIGSERPLPSYATAKCARCGACCYEKYILGETVVITEAPCPYLEPKGNSCRIYAKRQEIYPLCHSAAAAREAGALPADCPYVQGYPAYKPALRLAEHPEYAAEIAEILADEAEEP